MKKRKLIKTIFTFKYEFLDINRYDKYELYKNENISSAIFLLDQNINRIEFYDRLKDIVLGFNKLTIEEKSQLKHWLVNANSQEKDYKESIEKIFDSNKKEVSEMTSNISKGLEKLKEDGKTEGKVEMLIMLLTQKFSLVPKEYKEKISILPEKTIDKIATDIFLLNKIDDLKKYF